MFLYSLSVMFNDFYPPPLSHPCIKIAVVFNHSLINIGQVLKVLESPATERGLESLCYMFSDTEM